MGRTRFYVPVFAVAAVVALTIATQAYTTFGAWSVTPVVFYVNPANADVSAAAAEAALQAGMDVWNTQSGTSFRFSYGGRVNDTTTGNDGRSVIIFRNASNGGYLATTSAWSSNGSLIDSDIIFWDAGFTFFAGTSGCSGGVYIEDVAAHELGHALGLGHSSQADATMAPSMGWCSQEWRTLAADDIAAARSLYPSGGSTTKVPAAPSGLGVAAVSASSLAVSWADNANDETGYRLERSMDGASFATLAQLGANARSYTDSGLHSATWYHYRVTAYNSAGSSGYSNVGAAATATAATNTAPTVSIANPLAGASYPQGASITFSGSATDTQDGNLTSALAWTSTIDGSLGTGGGFSRALSAGSHTITARATDAGGMSGSRQVGVTVTVNSVGGPTLTARPYKVKAVKRVDLTWIGLLGATVDIYRNGAILATTPNDGQQTDTIASKKGGTFTYTVCATGTTTCSNQAVVVF